MSIYSKHVLRLNRLILADRSVESSEENLTNRLNSLDSKLTESLEILSLVFNNIINDLMLLKREIYKTKYKGVDE